MKKTIYTLLTALTFTAVSLQVSAQQKVKDGTVSGSPSLPHAGAVQELESTNKGQLLPRVSLASTTVWGLSGSPAAGMQVFNTNGSIVTGSTKYPVIAGNNPPATNGIGIYYWDGFGWVGTNYFKDQTNANNIQNPIVSAYKISTNQIEANNTPYVLDNFQETKDYNNSFDPANGQFTAPIRGTYYFEVNSDAMFNANWTSSVLLVFNVEKALAATPTVFAGVQNKAVDLSTNGGNPTTFAASFVFAPVVGNANLANGGAGRLPYAVSFTVPIQLEAGDKIRFQAKSYNNSGLYHLGISSYRISVTDY